LANKGAPAGCYTGSYSSIAFSSNDIVVSSRTTATGCSCCGGFEKRYSQLDGGITEVVIDKFFSFMLVPTLLIRRFDPSMSLKASAGLVENVRGLLRSRKKRTVVQVVEHIVHLIVGLLDISLGLAGLALNPKSPQKLYAKLKDPKASITFEGYSTLFLLWWLLGAALTVCMIPLRSRRRSIQIFGWPGTIAFTVATLASAVLFFLGCWKIDYARRHHLPWTPMLSYWIGGASAISFPFCGVEVFHTFGVVGLVFMLIHTFNGS